MSKSDAWGSGVIGATWGDADSADAGILNAMQQIEIDDAVALEFKPSCDADVTASGEDEFALNTMRHSKDSVACSAAIAAGPERRRLRRSCHEARSRRGIAGAVFVRRVAAHLIRLATLEGTWISRK